MRTISLTRPLTQPTAEQAEQLEAVARLRLSILRLARRIRQRADTGLTPSQLSALSTIERHGALRPGSLADHERIGKSSVTRLLANLEAQGQVQRLPDPADGRCAFVELTDEGRSLLKAFSEQADAFLARQVEALSAQEQRDLLAALPVLERLLAINIGTGKIGTGKIVSGTS
jgi:DNA-binding MarR family transcriptional regulator